MEEIELQPIDPERGSRPPPQEPKNRDVEEDEYFEAGRVAGGLAARADERTIVELRNIHKTYLLGVEGVPALRGVSLSIGRGEFVCVFGTSGGGKTSLLNICGTIDKPTKGDLSICGVRVGPRTPDKTLADLRLHRMGFVFQTFNLLSALTAQENVELPMILAGRLDRAERAARARSLLERVGLGARLDHLPSQLSGGEQQRVTIARAVANQPQLLLLDEPTGDLDSANSALVLQLLCELHRDGLTLVMVTHDVSLKHFADRVIWMRDGRIQRIETVTPAQRADVRARLDRDVAAIHERRRDHASISAPTVSRPTATSRTELRRPRDYSTYAAPLAAAPLLAPSPVAVRLPDDRSDIDDSSRNSRAALLPTTEQTAKTNSLIDA